MPNTYESKLTRISEVTHLDSVGVPAVRRVLAEIDQVLGSSGVYPFLKLRFARDVVERVISPSAVGAILDAIVYCRTLPKGHQNRINNEGKYFNKSMKELYRRAGVAWDPKDRPRVD